MVPPPVAAGDDVCYEFCAVLLMRLSPRISEDTSLYKDSIQSTKDSIAQQTLDVLYHDALDDYRDQRYDEALQLLDKIYSINPHYQDVADPAQFDSQKTCKAPRMSKRWGPSKNWMKKGDKAMNAGQQVLAISYWKQALQINPSYAPAKKKITDVNLGFGEKAI